MHPAIFPSILGEAKQKKSLKKPMVFLQKLSQEELQLSPSGSLKMGKKGAMLSRKKIRNVKTNQTLIPLLD